jgi:hypothetical protein
MAGHFLLGEAQTLESARTKNARKPGVILKIESD